jgi:beta-glucosidase
VAETVPARVPVPYWREQFDKVEQYVAVADFSRVQLLFLGDSITQGWDPAVFQQFYGRRAAFNLGVGSDTTQGLLWRLGRLPLGSTLRPRLVVMMIGTNNTYNPKFEDVALGIAENIRLIRARSPGSRVLVVGILPRGEKPQDPLRLLVQRINALVAQCADDANVFFANPGPNLLDAAGGLPTRLALDHLHLTPDGYVILATALEPTIRSLLGD